MGISLIHSCASLVRWRGIWLPSLLRYAGLRWGRPATSWGGGDEGGGKQFFLSSFFPLPTTPSASAPLPKGAYTEAWLAQGIDCTLRSPVQAYKLTSLQTTGHAHLTSRWSGGTAARALPLAPAVQCNSHSPADSLPAHVDSHWVRPLTEVPLAAHSWIRVALGEGEFTRLFLRTSQCSSSLSLPTISQLSEKVFSSFPHAAPHRSQWWECDGSVFAPQTRQGSRIQVCRVVQALGSSAHG